MKTNLKNVVFFVFFFSLFCPLISGAQIFTFGYSFNDPPCDPLKSNPGMANNSALWKVTHGSPSYYRENQNQSYSLLRLDANKVGIGGALQSEGLFANFPFKQGFLYTINVNCKTLPSEGGMMVLHVDAASNLEEKKATSCGEESVPTFNEKQPIIEASNIPSNSYGTFYNAEKKDWIPLKDYNQLLVYSDQLAFNRSGTIVIHSISIVCHGKELIKPSVPSNFNYSNLKPTSFTLTWNPSSDNSAIKEYEVFLNDKLYKTTSSTSIQLTNLVGFTEYSLKVRSVDIADNESDFSSALVVKTPYDFKCTINGSSLVCNSSQSSYMIDNLPDGATVVWSASPNLNFVGSNTSPSVTVQPTASAAGEAWVESTVTYSGQMFNVPRKMFWVGVPSIPSDISGLEPGGNYYESNEDVEFRVEYNRNQGVDRYQWLPTKARIISGQGTECVTVRMPNYTSNKQTTFSVNVKVGNSCGDSPNLGKLGYILGSGSRYLTYPNPSKDEVTIEPKKKIAQDSFETRNLILDEGIKSIRLFDMMGNLKRQYRYKGESFVKLNISDLPMGYYFIVINETEKNVILKQ